MRRQCSRFALLPARIGNMSNLLKRSWKQTPLILSNESIQQHYHVSCSFWGCVVRTICALQLARIKLLSTLYKLDATRSLLSPDGVENTNFFRIWNGYHVIAPDEEVYGTYGRSSKTFGVVLYRRK